MTFWALYQVTEPSGSKTFWKGWIRIRNRAQVIKNGSAILLIMYNNRVPASRQVSFEKSLTIFYFYTFEFCWSSKSCAVFILPLYTHWAEVRTDNRPEPCSLLTSLQSADRRRGERFFLLFLQTADYNDHACRSIQFTSFVKCLTCRPYRARLQLVGMLLYCYDVCMYCLPVYVLKWP